MRKKIIRLTAIISYLLIILMGSIIGLPFLFWLGYTLFDFGNVDQFFALLAITGLIISYKTWNSPRNLRTISLDILVFILLCSPIIRRMSVVPIEKFNYLAFIIPSIIFVILYIVSIFLKSESTSKQEKTY